MKYVKQEENFLWHPRIDFSDNSKYEKYISVVI